MTQQPYAQPGYPPQQQYPPQYPQAPQQPGYAPPPPQYAPPMQPGYPPQQGYGQAPGQPMAGPPLAQGGLDEFYSQPSAGSGPGIGWHDGTPMKNPRPHGTTWVGVVVRDVSNADVQQQTSPQGMPAYFRDGRPKFQMKVPLKQVALFADPGLAQRLALPADMPEAEGTWYVRGQGRDELTRAMAEAGCQGAPAAGATVVITLVNRRPNGGGMQPSNIVQVRYIPAEGGQGAQPSAQSAPQTPVPAQQPVPQQAPVQPPQGYVPEQTAVPGQQLPPLPPQAYAPDAQPLQPVQQGQQPAQQYAPPTGYGQPQGVPQQQQQAPQQAVQQAPVQQGQPPQFDAEQAALFARITGQPQQGQPAA